MAIILFFLGTGLTMQFCAKHNVASYGQVLTSLDSNSKAIFEILYALFLIVGTGVMLAGMGAMGETFWAGFLFRLGSGILVYFVVHRGVDGVLKMSIWLAPLLVVGLCAIALFHVHPVDYPLTGSMSLRALEAGMLYACYNLGFSMAVLATLHRYLPTAKLRWQAAFVGSLVLGACLLLLYFALSTLTQAQLQDPFPLVHLLGRWGHGAGIIYKLLLWAAMYTTAVANSLALVSRLSEFRHISWRKSTFAVVGLGLVLSYFGFNNLIRIGYPILGLAGLWILAHLLRELRV